jgi:putative transcriptional regulator
MKKELFEELVESIKEGGRILKGRAKPKRAFKYDELDVRKIRERLHLSQTKFSALLGISPATLRNWEQSRRKPHGPARVLLRVAEKNPKCVLEAVYG